MADVRKPWVLRLMIPIVMITVGLAGACSSGSTTADSSPSAVPAPGTSPPAYCAAADRLKTSITGLRSVNVVTGGLDAIKAALATVQTNLDQFRAAASTQYGPETTQLSTSLTNLQAAITAAQANANASTVAAVASAVASVVSSYDTLRKAVANNCP